MSWFSKHVSDPIINNPVSGIGIINRLDEARRGIVDPGDGTRPGELNPQQQMAQQIASKSFSSFGYNASPEELASFSAIYHSENGGNQLQVNSAVSNYIQTVKRFQDLNANDPTKQVLADEKGFFNQTQARAAGYEKDASGIYQQMKDVAGQAPKLFGNLSPEQIDQYLAPTKRANDEANARLQGQAAARGLAGSSTELNTLADQDRQYKENVLSAGLNLGLQQQQTQLGVLGGRQTQLFNAGQNQLAQLPGSLGRQANIATNQQQAKTDQANYLNQLPLFLASANPQPTLPPPTGSKNFFDPGQPGAGVLPGLIQGVSQGAGSALAAGMMA